MTNAPATRETADHAELAGCPFCGGPHLKHIAVSSEDEPTWQIAWQVFCETCHSRGPASVRIGWCETKPDASFAWNRRPREAALLSEIAALRGLLDEAQQSCRAMGEKFDALNDKWFSETQLRTQAERQRDELRKALERLASSEAFETPRVIDGPLAPEMRARLDYARQALATQGADQ